MAAVARALAQLERSPDWLHGLLCRWAIAGVFWRSARTKVHDLFSMNDATFDLFREEYRVPILPSDVAAVITTVSEHLFSVLLVIGLASRLSAAGLFCITLVIEIFVYPDSWPDHLLWSSALLYVLLRGPGQVSLDHLIRRKLPG